MMLSPTKEAIRHWAWQAVVLGALALTLYVGLTWLFSLDPTQHDPRGQAAATVGSLIVFAFIVALPFALVVNFLIRRYGSKE